MRRSLAAALAFVLVACGSPGSENSLLPDVDAGDGVHADAPPDAPADAPGDAPPDAPEDGLPDAAADAPPDASACTARDQACDPALHEPSDSFVCVATASGAGACREACSSGGCSAGLRCLRSGFCAPATCASFRSDACGAGAQCLVSGGDGICVATGRQGAGAPCGGADACQAQLVCVGGGCRSPDCTVAGPEGCLDPLAGCVPYVTSPSGAPSDIGECAVLCDPFAGGGSCPDGEACRPWAPDSDGAVKGACVPLDAPAAGEGEDCATSACHSGLTCIQHDDGARCETLCAPGASTGEVGACDMASHCQPALTIGPFGPTPAGWCALGCDPFADPASCPEGQWCQPSGESATSGACVSSSSASAELGFPCGPSTCCGPLGGEGCPDADIEACVCADDPFCCSFGWDGLCAYKVTELGCASCTESPPERTCVAGLTCVESLCETACDPAAADPSGVCPEGLSCRPLGDSSDAGGLGFCAEGCDYHQGVGCADPDTSYCAPGELFDSPFDICVGIPEGNWPLAIDQLCSEGPFDTFCAPARRCLPYKTGKLACSELCFETEGPLGVAGHPECADPAAVCTSLGPPDWGVCL